MNGPEVNGAAQPAGPTPPPHQGEPAGVVTRGLAALVDVGVVAVGLAGIYVGWTAVVFAWSPQSFSWPAPGPAALLGIAVALSVAYLTAGWATAGRTYGTALLGLRVVRRSGDHLHWAGALLRAVACTVFPIGLAWVAVSPRRWSVQDALLGTRVVYDWSRALTHPPAAPR